MTASLRSSVKSGSIRKGGPSDGSVKASTDLLHLDNPVCVGGLHPEPSQIRALVKFIQSGGNSGDARYDASAYTPSSVGIIRHGVIHFKVSALVGWGVAATNLVAVFIGIKFLLLHTESVNNLLLL